MRGRSVAGLLTAGALLAAGTQTGLPALALVALAPAYDAVTQASVRNLAVALESAAMLDGDLDAMTVEELAGWGWTPQSTSAVVIEVDGATFRAVVRDVRPGAAEYAAVSGPDGGVRVGRVDPATPAVTPDVAGVTILVAGSR